MLKSTWPMSCPFFLAAAYTKRLELDGERQTPLAVCHSPSVRRSLSVRRSPFAASRSPWCSILDEKVPIWLEIALESIVLVPIELKIRDMPYLTIRKNYVT